MAKKLCIILMALGIVGLQRQVSAQTPLGTDFTYQGQLKASGLPAVANADIQFLLFDAASGGAQVGSMQPKDNVALVNGAFTLSLDFGATAFSGDARWLQVAVRSPAGSGDYTTLTPRQPITVTPHSNYALQTRGITVDQAERVGIGTPPANIPESKLDVNGHVVVGNNSGYLIKNSDGNSATSGLRSFGNNQLALVTGQQARVVVASDGKVAMGLASADAQLHIRSPAPDIDALTLQGPGSASLKFHPEGVVIGDTFGAIGFIHEDNPDLYIRNSIPFGRIVFQGNSPNLVRYPATAAEDLRIVRGRIAGDGTIESGTGFTVTHVSEGEYVIDYQFPFVDIPAVTATINSFGFSACFVELRANSAGGCAPNVIRRSDGNHVDGYFNFIAIGQR